MGSQNLTSDSPGLHFRSTDELLHLFACHFNQTSLTFQLVYMPFHLSFFKKTFLLITPSLLFIFIYLPRMKIFTLKNYRLTIYNCLINFFELKNLSVSLVIYGIAPRFHRDTYPTTLFFLFSHLLPSFLSMSNSSIFSPIKRAFQSSETNHLH